MLTVPKSSGPRRLAVVPTDPLSTYVDKGISSWLAGYFNPQNYFDEVYCLSPWEPRAGEQFGMRVVPTPPGEFRERLRALRIQIVRAYGGFNACDVACRNKVEGVPVVVSVHDTAPELLHDTIRAADHVLAVSRAVRELVIARGVEPERVQLLPNRVDTELFAPCPDEVFRARLAKRYGGRYRLLHIGRKTPQKNLDTLIRALALLGGEYVGLFVGGGDDKPYRVLAAELGVAHRCHFIQSIPNSDLPLYYSNCDCFCTPSRWEGFGIVFIEALACGAAVVTSDIAPMNEFITGGEQALLVRDFENPAALAEAVRAICCDADLRARLTRRAPSAAAPFERSAVDAREAALYHWFLGNSPSKGILAPTSMDGLPARPLPAPNESPMPATKIKPDATKDSAQPEQRAAREREKWDRVYDQMVVIETPEFRTFNQEMAEIVGELLPNGGRILEAGCGGGLQSLGIARQKRYDLHLMDFSSKALQAARDLFTREGLAAEFSTADVNLPGQPEHDLVFNAGVLEHYSFDEQVSFLRGMASRSKRYVLALVPNRLAYWYWVWRLQDSAAGRWPYGNEAPQVDLSAVFKGAGLQFCGQAFVAEAWTEAFIRNLDGLAPALAEKILALHREPLVSKSQKAYLVAALGTVDKQTVVPVRWQPPLMEEPLERAELAAALADALSMRVGAEQQIAQLRSELNATESKFRADTVRLAELETLAPQLKHALTEKQRELDDHLALRDRLVRELTEWRESEAKLAQQRFAAKEQELSLSLQLWQRFRADADAQLAALSAETETARATLRAAEQRIADAEAVLAEVAQLRSARAELETSIAWKILRRVRRVRRFVAPDGSLRHRMLRGVWQLLRRSKSGLRTIGHWLSIEIPLPLPQKMSWYAYAFERFKRQRAARFPASLTKVRCPSEPGLVSVILPVYNGADYVRESLDSALAQTYSPYELIVVDDGSTDDTPTILADYAQRFPQIRVIRQVNQKLPAALNTGFAAARGEFLTWTSADNRFKPEFLTEMVASMQRHPHWELIYANEEIIGEEGTVLRDAEWFSGYQSPPGSGCIHLPVDPSELNTWANNYVGAAFMYRDRTAALLGSYSPRRFGLEDYDYWMRANSLLTLRHADFLKPVYDYRFHRDSLTSKDKEIGITRNRGRLMVFEDFRRNFYLDPIHWCVESVGDETAGAVNELRRTYEKAGHAGMTRAALTAGGLPRLWLPTAYVAVTKTPGAGLSPPADLPPATLRVLLAVTDQELPAVVDARWDLCVALSSVAAPVRLPRPGQGWLVVPDVDSAVQTIDIRCRSAHLDLIETEISNPPPPTLAATIIICAYWRAERLQRAIDSVIGQVLEAANCEIIIVNNAPEDTAVPELVARLRTAHFAKQPDRLRLITCPTPGLSHARNAGLAEARGEVLCFLDDDAVAEAGWLKTMIGAFAAHPQAGVIGGRIMLRTPEPAPAWLKPHWYAFWSHFDPGDGPYREVTNWWEFPWGANWAVRRAALLAIGGFRTAYGRRGKDYGGGEETTAAMLIRSLEYSVGIEPASVVRHDVEPERFSLTHVRKTIQAGLRVNFNSQLDLHMPMETRFSLSVSRAFKHLLKGFNPRSPRWERWRDRTYATGYAGLAWDQFLHGCARLRRPLVRRK